jgi:AraC-like DNA-binding protein
MQQATPHIRSSLLAEFAALVRELGGPLDDILEAAGLSLEQIEQPTLLIPLDRQVRLLQIAALRCDCEAFALELARRQDMAVFGALGVLAMQSASVRQALQLFARYLHYCVQAVDVEFREEGDLVFVTVTCPFEVARASDQFWDHAIGMLWTVSRMICGDGWRPRAVFTCRPETADPEHYSRYFRAPVAFGSEHSGLVFKAEVLDRPVGGSLTAVPQQLQRYLNASFADDFLEQIRRVINSLLPTRDCNTGTVAYCLGLSKRSLQRKLQEERTTFQRQLDAVRAELAIGYLQKSQLSLTDIGELLGFAEAAVFSRTFRRWFGVTPSQWRSRKFLPTETGAISQNVAR